MIVEWPSRLDDVAVKAIAGMLCDLALDLGAARSVTVVLVVFKDVTQLGLRDLYIEKKATLPIRSASCSRVQSRTWIAQLHQTATHLTRVQSLKNLSPGLAYVFSLATNHFPEYSDGVCVFVLGAQVKAKKAAAMRDINSRRGDLTPSQQVHEHERL